MMQMLFVYLSGVKKKAFDFVAMVGMGEKPSPLLEETMRVNGETPLHLYFKLIVRKRMETLLPSRFVNN